MARENSFLDALVKLSEELEAAERNLRFRSDGIGRANPETRQNPPNSSIESEINFSASSFSRETGVAPSPAAPFSIPGYGSRIHISISDSLVGAGRAISKAMAENPVDSFPVPAETITGEFRRLGETQSNSFEHFSTNQYVGWSHWRPVHELSTNPNPVSEASHCSKEGNKASEFLRKRKRLHSTSTPLMSAEGDGNKDEVPKLKYRREITKESAEDNSIEDSSSNEHSTSVALGSAIDADGVPIAGPSGIPAKPNKNGKQEQFLCDPCGKAADRKRRRGKNHRSYTGEKFSVCPTCGKGFTRNDKLKRHLETHTGEKPFSCDACDKRFNRKDVLERHLLTHTGLKPFSCEVCGKRFALKHHLQVHLRTHTGLKPFFCEVCGKRFTLKHHLQVHLRTHSGEKPYTCKWCGMKFSDPSHYRRHLKHVHGEE